MGCGPDGSAEFRLVTVRSLVINSARPLARRTTRYAAGIATAAVVGAGALTSPIAAAPAGVGGFVVTFAAPPTARDLDVVGSLALGVHGFDHIPAAAVTLPSSLTGLLRALPGVTGVYPDRMFRYLDDQSVQTVKANQVWSDPSLGYDGSGVGIGVIDAGVDGTHPDLCAAPQF